MASEEAGLWCREDGETTQGNKIGDYMGAPLNGGFCSVGTTKGPRPPNDLLLQLTPAGRNIASLPTPTTASALPLRYKRLPLGLDWLVWHWRCRWSARRL